MTIDIAEIFRIGKVVLWMGGPTSLWLPFYQRSRLSVSYGLLSGLGSDSLVEVLTEIRYKGR